MQIPKNCPCGYPKAYADCCGRIHSDITAAHTAEQLMRSRYSAFVLAKGAYLQKSHHATTRPTHQENKALLKWTKSVQWLRLQVLNATKGMQQDQEGTVEFKAFYYENGTLEMIHERSSFVKQHGHWVYLDAQ